MSTYWELHGIYGLLAEFLDAETLMRAAQNAYAAGYRKMDALSLIHISEPTRP